DLLDDLGDAGLQVGRTGVGRGGLGAGPADVVEGVDDVDEHGHHGPRTVFGAPALDLALRAARAQQLVEHLPQHRVLFGSQVSISLCRWRWNHSSAGDLVEWAGCPVQVDVARDAVYTPRVRVLVHHGPRGEVGRAAGRAVVVRDPRERVRRQGAVANLVAVERAARVHHHPVVVDHLAQPG